MVTSTATLTSTPNLTRVFLRPATGTNTASHSIVVRAASFVQQSIRGRAQDVRYSKPGYPKDGRVHLTRLSDGTVVASKRETRG